MTDLTDFLLARVADDERVWGNGAFAPVAGQGLSRLILKTRAECKSKRRIVDAHRMSYADAADETWARNGRCDECGAAVPCQTLRLLALPYADHPDFREEWRL